MNGPSVLADAIRRAGSDWLLGGLGVSAAAVSASFAIFMIAVGPGDLGARTSGNFNIFVHWDRRAGRPAVRDLADAAPAPASRSRPLPTPAPTATSNRTDVDFTPTGTIALASTDAVPAPARQPDAGTRLPERPSRRLQDFVVRDVFDGKAVIEGRNKLHIVEPGSVLDDAVQVLSIERRGQHWVVETSAGTIGN